MKLPFTPGPPNGLALVSRIVSLSTRFRPSVPLPVPVFAVTVYWFPLPLTVVIVAPATVPVVTRVKSPASTAVTLSLNSTVHDTLAAFVGVVPTRLIDCTVGAIVSVAAAAALKVATCMTHAAEPPSGAVAL